MTPQLTQTEVRRLLCYNPLSGNFMWRINISNKIKSESLAGCVQKDSSGKLWWSIKIYGHRNRAHRLAFLYMRGYWPNNQIDHKDNDPLNNKWLNLRECTGSQNCANRGASKTNKLGIRGITRTSSGKYIVQVYKDRKRVFKDRFDTLEDAKNTYKIMSRKYHGEFAFQGDQ